MGLFRIDYSKAGPGIAKNAPQKKGLALLWDIYSRVFWELIKLNVLFILFSLPIVTIGPAFAGMSRVMMLMVRERPFFVWGDFWQGFRENWRQSLPAGVLAMLSGGMLYVALAFYAAQAQVQPIMYVPLVVTGVMLLVVGLACVYLFPMLVSFNFTFSVLLKNAFLLGIAGLKHALPAMLVAVIGAAAIILYLPLSVPIPAFFYFSHTAFFYCFAAWPGLNRYVANREPPLSEIKEK